MYDYSFIVNLDCRGYEGTDVCEFSSIKDGSTIQSCPSVFQRKYSQIILLITESEDHLVNLFICVSYLGLATGVKLRHPHSSVVVLGSSVVGCLEMLPVPCIRINSYSCWLGRICYEAMLLFQS